MRLARSAVLHSLGAAAALLPLSDVRTLAATPMMRRVRPGDPDWPSPAMWEQLNHPDLFWALKVSPSGHASTDPAGRSGAQAAASASILRSKRLRSFGSR